VQKAHEPGSVITGVAGMKNLPASPRNGQRLVNPFAAGENGIFAAADGFAGLDKWSTRYTWSIFSEPKLITRI
jgi:hypothetical protein